MRRAYKYRVYPTKSQVSRIENQFSMCRYLYNWSLTERKEAYEQEQRSVSYRHQQNALPELKKSKPWFKSVHSQVLQNVLKRLDLAFQSFFRRVKSGETPGFPKFKKRGQWSSITYPQFKTHPKDNQIQIPKIGTMTIKVHRSIPKDAQIKTLTLTKEGGKWYVCFSWEQLVSIESKPIHSTEGIDLGLNDFVYSSNGFHLPPPKAYRQKERQLQRLQRRFSKSKKHTSEYKKLLKALQKCHQRVKFQRNEFLHKTANEVLSQSDAVAVEDLKIASMKRKPKPKTGEKEGEYLPNGASWKAGLNKSISDVGWGQFVDLLIYKAESVGKTVVKVDPKGTSQICSGCGVKVKKTLATRIHRCVSCGLVLNRDHNAALNMKRLGLQSLGFSQEAPTRAVA